MQRALLSGGLAPSEVCIQAEALGLLLVGSRRHHTSLLVLAHALFEEVGLPLQGDQLHPIEGIRCTEKLRMPKRREQSVGHELNVPRHELAVHPDEVTWQRLTDKTPLR